ncbi:MAG: hypothetical protein ACE366_08735 [Bradymonadia bacterium]
MNERNPTSIPEHQRRLVYSLLRPVARLCRRFHLPLKAVEELCRLAYYEELKRTPDLTQTDMARLLGTSLRTVGNLAHQHRGDFLSPEQEQGLAREIEEALSHGPLSLDGLIAALTHVSPDQIQRLLPSLVDSGRLTAEAGSPVTYRLEPAWVSLVREDMQARIDGLNHQLDVIAAAVRTRFLAIDERPAVARTLSFAGTPEDMQKLGRAIAQQLRVLCSEAEEDALEAGGHQRYAVTFALAPVDEPPHSAQDDDLAHRAPKTGTRRKK